MAGVPPRPGLERRRREDPNNPEEGAIATPRNRHVDHALRVTPKGARRASAAILGLGLLVLWVVLFTGDRGRERNAGKIAVGADSARVAAALGPPGRACATGALENLRDHFPPDLPRATVESTLDRLRRETARRWVYPRRGEEPGCAARPGTTEVGIGRDGRVLWYVPVTGRTPLVLPEAWGVTTT